jgi:hypothetical protein
MKILEYWILVSLLMSLMSCEENPTKSEQIIRPKRAQADWNSSAAQGLRQPTIKCETQEARSPEVKEWLDKLVAGEISIEEFWDQNSGLSVALLEELFQVNPSFAISLAERAPDSMREMHARALVIDAWSRAEPLAVLNWIESSSLDRRQKSGLLTALINSAGQIARETSSYRPWLQVLSELKAKMPNSAATATLELHIASGIAFSEGSVDGLAILAATGELTDSGINGYLSSKADRDPYEIVKYLESRPDIESRWYNSGGGSTLIRALAKNSPSEAFSFAVGMEDIKYREANISLATELWLPVSAQNASQSIGALRSGPVKDVAILAMAQWLKRSGSAHEIEPWLSHVSSKDKKEQIAELFK